MKLGSPERARIDGFEVAHVACVPARGQAIRERTVLRAPVAARWVG